MEQDKIIKLLEFLTTDAIIEADKHSIVIKNFQYDLTLVSTFILKIYENLNVTSIKKAKDELVDYHNKFMSIMNDYEIDVYFSELAAEYNLTPVDLTINEASETEIKSFSVALQEAKAESNSKSETTSNKSEEKEENPKTLVANVQQKVTGSPTNIARYIGKISENTGVALTQLQYTYNRDSTKEYTILTYNLYMIEK